LQLRHHVAKTATTVGNSDPIDTESAARTLRKRNDTDCADTECTTGVTESKTAAVAHARHNPVIVLVMRLLDTEVKLPTAPLTPR
jgi:hypothetical protein